MLLGEVRVGHSKTHGKEVDSGLPLWVGYNQLPARLIPVWVVYYKETTIGSLQLSNACGALSNNTITLFQTPYHTFKTALRRTLSTREEHLSVEPVKEGRM